VVFGTKRDNKPDSDLREDVVGNLYPDSFPNEAEMTPSPMDYRRPDPGNESVIDPHARFNGKYVSDRDLRIEGEATGEIECAANVIINGDFEGDVNCGGRFEIGSTGRVKGKVKAQVLVVREGAHFEGGVIMTPEGRAAASATPATPSAPAPAASPAKGAAQGAAQPAAAASSQGSVFGKESAPPSEPAASGSGSNS